MDILSKFAMSQKDKKSFADFISNKLIEQFDAYQSSYQNIFKGLPYEVLEGMSQQQAGELLSMVMKEAQGNIARSLDLMKEEFRKVASDEDKMNEIRAKFMESLKEREGVQADVPDTLKEEGVGEG